MDTKKPIWDPVREQIITSSFGYELKNTMFHYQKAPHLFKVYMGICMGIGVLTTLLFFIFAFNNNPFDIRILLASFIPAALYYFQVNQLQEESILQQLCERNNWAFNPKEDHGRPLRFIEMIPEVFDIGRDQNFDQQVWGTVPYKGSTVPFYSAKFTYTTGSGKNKTTTSQPIVIFKLLSPLPVDLTLKSVNFLTRDIFSSFKTESHDFNNMFQIEDQGADSSTKQEIVKLLSPAVQTRLTEFSKKYKTYKIVFYHDLMILVLQKSLWQTKHTNFFRSAKISEKDVELFNKDLIDMASLPSEMIQFMD